MFEIGFSEILVIMAIALVVLGPEKLPKLAATVGRWMGRAKAMARQFREQLEEEANKLELTKELNRQMDLAKSRLDLAKSLGLNDDLTPATPDKPVNAAPGEAATAEPAPGTDPATAAGHMGEGQGSEPPAPGAPRPEPPRPEAPARDPWADESSAAEAPAVSIKPAADSAPQTEHAPAGTPAATPSVEASVDSVHERRH